MSIQVQAYVDDSYSKQVAFMCSVELFLLRNDGHRLLGSGKNCSSSQNYNGVVSVVTGCVNRRIDGEACAGEDKGRSRPLDLFNGMAIQGDGLPVASLV
jgi:hypothetical protein